MKRLPLLLAASLLGFPLGAQTPAPSVAADPAMPLLALRPAQELEQLVAPIALYPDALIALILPAATAPTDIVLAARQMRETPGDRSQVEHRAWDESVKSLTHYPEVLQWLDENLQWTRQLGEAFAQQPADVMQAVQRLRARARAAGTLVDTPQQQVISETEVIRIVPAQPDVIYVPHYAPEVFFVNSPAYYYPRPFLTFGVGVAVGSWLAFDCDWRRNTIWMGNRHRTWVRHDWRRPVIPIAPLHPPPYYRGAPEVRPWRPASSIRPTVAVGTRVRTDVVRPAPIGAGFASTNRTGRADFSRRPTPSSLPAVPPLAPSFVPAPRGERFGPRPPAPGPSAVDTPTRATPPPVTMPNLQPLPTARRPERTVQRSNPAPAPVAPPVADPNRGRHYRGSHDVLGRSAPAHVATAAPVVPPLRMSPGETPRPASSQFPTRSYSRSQPPPAPPAPSSTVAPTAPTPTAPAAVPQGGASRGHRGGGSSRSEGWGRSR